MMPPTVDGATGLRRLIYVTFPLLANVYLVCDAALDAVDYRRLSPRPTSSPAAHRQFTEVLATYGFHKAFDFGYPKLGVAAMMSALPVLIPIVILLMRRLRATGVQL